MAFRTRLTINADKVWGNIFETREKKRSCSSLSCVICNCNFLKRFVPPTIYLHRKRRNKHNTQICWIIDNCKVIFIVGMSHCFRKEREGREGEGRKGRDRETRSSNYNAVSLTLNLNLFLSSLESISLSRQGKPWNGEITSCVVVIYVFLSDYGRDIVTSEYRWMCIPANQLFFLMRSIIFFNISLRFFFRWYRTHTSA